MKKLPCPTMGCLIPAQHVAEMCKHVELQPGPSPFEFVSVSLNFVANPADPKARVFRHCSECNADFPDSHPDNGCPMADVFNTHES